MLDQSASGLDKADLVRIAGGLSVPGGITIDLSAEPHLGAPLVVLRLPASGELPPVLGSLSPREREVTVLIAAGLSNKLIARRLGIALSTVKDHVHHVLQKTELPNRAALAALFAPRV